MKYRPHIDGLRALAVIPVVIFHLGSNIMPGGYIGVDVFFVISGYLITTILIDDIKASRYSLLEFYKRRILRILPALCTVVAFTLLASTFLLLPAEQRELGKSIVATASFLSNFYFWSESDYFSAPAESMALLHTWSLAVEEQFYIFFPILLLALSKYAKSHITHTIIFLSCASLALCLLLTQLHQETAFYLLPTRAWELGIGAILATWVLNNPNTQRANPYLAISGLFLIFAPILLLEKSSVFPGWNALYPTIGAALLIGWANGTIVGRLLSLAPLVWIGKISYSFYLWHWPLIVFWKLQFGQDLSGVEMTFLFSLSIISAAASTSFIEKPFRSKKLRQASSKKIVLAGVCSLLIMALLGGVVSQRHISLTPLPPDVRRTASAIDYRTWPDYQRQFRTGQCLIGQANNGFEDYDPNICAALDDSKPNILLIGDSHAAQFWGPLKKLLPEANIMQATSSGCRPLIGSPGAKRCTDLRDWVFEKLLPSTRIDAVIVGGRWVEKDLIFVHQTIDRLKKLTGAVIVIGPTVEYQGSLPTLLARSQLKGQEFDFSKHLNPGREEVNKAMEAIALEAQVTYVDILSTLCNQRECILYAPDRVPMQFDYGHLTFSGAMFALQRNGVLFSQLIKHAPDTE